MLYRFPSKQKILLRYESKFDDYVPEKIVTRFGVSEEEKGALVILENCDMILKIIARFLD